MTMVEASFIDIKIIGFTEWNYETALAVDRNEPPNGCHFMVEQIILTQEK